MLLDVFLQCFDTVGWVAGRASGPYKPLPLIPRDSFPEYVEWLTNPGVTGKRP